MNRSAKSLLASLLVSAILAAPGGALASEPAPTLPAKILPAPTAPVKGGEAEVLVEPKLGRDEAIAIARKYFSIPDELGEPNVGIQQSRAAAAWSLEWQSPSKRQEQTRISVSIDAVTGTVLSYSRWSTGSDQPLQLSFTRSEAQKKAEEWLERLVPAEYRESLRFVETPLNAGYWGGTSYPFNWMRVVQGYPLASGGLNITIDARTGEMNQYNLNWRPALELKLPEQVLIPAEAAKLYAREVPMVLQYQRFSKRGTDEAEWKLVYQPLTGSFPQMNQQGVLVDWQGEPLDLAALQNTRPVPASEKPYQKPAKPLSQEEALAIARGITGRSDAPTQGSYSEYGEETKRRAWDFTWVTEGGEDQRRTEQRVRIDAETGLVTELNHWTDSKPFGKDEVVPVSLEQAQEKAIAFLRSHRPDLAGNLRLMASPKDAYIKDNPEYRPTEYYIGFQQLREQIPVAGREIRIAIDARTGKIRNFWSGWWDEKPNEAFPAPQPLISAAKAMALFLQHQGIAATWITHWSPKTGSEGEPSLLWQPAPTLPIQSIDARAGVPLDYEGRNLIEAQRYPSDIKGHYAEREIELLWARGVFELQDGKFNPDMVISADELARWIVLARGMRPFTTYDFGKLESLPAAAPAARQAKASTNAAYFGAALQNGIILPEDFEAIQDLNQPVTREIFALWAVRAMGFGRIAKMEARIAMSFGDQDAVGARYRNAVALLSGLGIVSGDGAGNFGPQRWLTRADAARILFAVSAQ